MKNGKLVILAALAAMAIFTAVPSTALGGDQDQERGKLMLHDQTRLMQQICKDTELSQEEIEIIRPEVNRSLQVAGDGEPVHSMVKAAKSEGCQGECLAESLRLHTRAMEQGYSGEEAQGMIRREIRNCVQVRNEIGMNDAEMGQWLRNRVEARILARINQGKGGSSKSAGMGGSTSGSYQTRSSGDSGSAGRGSGGKM
jgi:hypothetical protein